MLLEKVATALRGIQLCVLSTAPVKMIPGDDPLLTCIIRPGSGTMRQIIEGSSLVITRAGYTSVMELVSLGKGAVLIPTPGQPEQEYLGDWLNGHHGFITIVQKKVENLRTLAEGIMLNDRDPSLQQPDTVPVVETALNQLTDSDPMVEAAGPQLSGCTPPGKTTRTQFPDSSGLFEQTLNLLLEQKKE